MIEEEIFYPACEGTVEEDLLKESYVEHDAAKLLIAEIEAGAGESDEYFDSKVKVLPKRSSITSRKKRSDRRCVRAGAQGRARPGLAWRAARRAEGGAGGSYKASGVPEPELTTMDEVSV